MTKLTRLTILGAAAVLALGASLASCGRTDGGAAPAAPADTGKIGDAVKADVARLVADFNAHDAAKASAHDAPDVVAMAHGQPNVVGSAADLAGGQKAFAADPTQSVSVGDPVVDVAGSGDMAVYRSTYVYRGMDPKTKKPMTEHGNYLAGYKKQPDGSWKIAWSVISDTGPVAAK